MSRSRQKCEVHWTEDKVSVVSVKTTAAEKFNIPMKDQLIVFGGRILKDDKSLADYSIKEGSTLHVLRRAPTTEKIDMPAEMESMEQDEDHQISNRQAIDDLVAELVRHPRLLQGVLLNEEHTRSNPATRARLLQPDMVERLRDPAYVRRLLEGNASLIAAVQQHLDSWDIFDEDIPYDPDYFVDANDPGTQELEGTPSQEASATATVSSSPGSSISSAQLATALARAQGRPSTLPVSESPSSSASLFGIPQASPISPLWPPYPQQPGTAQNQHHVTSPTIATISSEALTRALAGARASTETPAPTRWAQQLQQIQEFGVWDQAACIRALEETGGDVEAAVELLVNEGIM